MRSALLVIAACLIVLLLPSTFAAINEFRSTDYVEPHTVATGVGVTEADVVLSQELFGGRTYNAAIASDNVSDLPIPDSYVEATQTLTVTGLNADDTRTLTITYKIDALEYDIGVGIATRVFPIFLVLGVIGLIAGAMYNAFHRAD